MAKKDNEKLVATDELRVLAHKITEARAAKKAWAETDATYTETAKSTVPVNTTLVTADGREVMSITEGELPKATYDYARYFDEHPAEKAELEANYRLPQRDATVTLTTKWVEPSETVPAGATS